MNARILFAAALLLSWGSLPLFAELPPSVYEKKQAEAPEKLQLQIMRVQVEPGAKPEEQSVRLTALVETVDRSASGVSRGDFVTIAYTVTEHPIGWAGPGPVPIPNEKDKTVAYLQRIPDSGDYAPAAGAMTFSHF